LLIDDQSDAPTYVSPRGRDHPTVRYSLLQSPAAIPSIGEAAHLRGFDGRICVRVPGADAARYLFLAAEDFRGPGLLQSYLPDSTTFVHLSHREASHVQAQPSAALQRVAGADAPAGRGSCPTSDWRPAEVIVDELELALPAGLPAVDHFLAIGLYAPGGGPRLRIPGHADDQIIIGPFPVRPAS
jgi:hypothetical protein